MNEFVFQAIIITMIIAGILLRIIIQQGYILLPEVKREGLKIKIKLNVLGTIGASILVIIGLYNNNPALFSNAISAFLIAYMPGHFIDTFYYKTADFKNNEEPPVMPPLGVPEGAIV